MLYIGLGDGGGDGDPGGRGQAVTDLLGDILRVDVSSGTGYTVPADNPFVGRTDARPEIWSYGLRNPWRFSFDPATGDLYIADVGQNAWEEVDVVTAAARSRARHQLRLEPDRRDPLLRHALVRSRCVHPSRARVLAQRGMFDHRRLRVPGRCHSRPAGALFLLRFLPRVGAQLSAAGRSGGGAAAVVGARPRRTASPASGRMPPASSTS